MRGVFIADAPDERATPGLIKGQNAEKVLEAARETFRAVVFLGVDVPQLSGGGDEYLFAGLDVDASVNPGFIAGQLDFLREALLSLGRLCGRGILHLLAGRCLLRRPGNIFANKLRVNGIRERDCEEQPPENQW